VESQVTVREDADELAVARGDRDARDPVAAHDLLGVADEPIGSERDRVENHAALRTLHLVHFVGLSFG
jgi:hypothetical protein